MSKQHGKLLETWGFGGARPPLFLFAYDEKITIFLRVTKPNLQGKEFAKIFNKERVLKIWVEFIHVAPD